MSKSDTFENALMLLIFNNTDIANIGDAAGLLGSATAGNLWLALHTADPGEAGSAITSETAYENYARVAVARASGAGGFTVSGNSVSPTDDETFPAAGPTSPGGPLTHWSVVNTSSGAGIILYRGTLTPNITMAEGVAPKIKNTSTITED
jgi:hypothetical protein